MHLLRPSASALRTVAPPLGHAFKEGAVNLSAATALNLRLAESSEALAQFGENPVVTLAFEDFTKTLEVGGPLLAQVAPEQAKCNYLTLAFRNLASLQSESVGVGTLARAGVVISPTGPNNEGLPSSAPANGPSTELSQKATPALPNPATLDSNRVHVNAYPNVSAPGQRQVCEAGKTTYVVGKAVIGPASEVSSGAEITTRKTSLYNEEYPASTLKALGESKGASK